MTRSNSTLSSIDRSGRAMEEDSNTVKSEFRLGMMCIVHTEFIYRWMRKGKCYLGVSWSGFCNEKGINSLTMSTSSCP